MAAGLLFAVGGCAKKSGVAVVLSKEHIDARPAATPSPDAGTENGGEARLMREDEILVDGYVMKPEMRGTANDPRATTTEQWLVKVRLVDTGRQINVPTEKRPWERIKVGDRVKVSYAEGKYTGTIWGAQIE